MCVSIEVRPSHTTNAEPISPLVTSVEAILRLMLERRTNERTANAIAYRRYDFDHLKASVTLLIPTLLVMRSRIRNEVSPYLRVACVQLPMRKLPERLPTAWVCFLKLLFPP